MEGVIYFIVLILVVLVWDYYQRNKKSRRVGKEFKYTYYNSDARILLITYNDGTQQQYKYLSSGVWMNVNGDTVNKEKCKILSDIRTTYLLKLKYANKAKEINKLYQLN